MSVPLRYRKNRADPQPIMSPMGGSDVFSGDATYQSPSPKTMSPINVQRSQFVAQLQGKQPPTQNQPASHQNSPQPEMAPPTPPTHARQMGSPQPRVNSPSGFSSPQGFSSPHGISSPHGVSSPRGISSPLASPSGAQQRMNIPPQEYAQYVQYAQQYAQQYARQHGQQLTPEYLRQYTQQYAQYAHAQQLRQREQPQRAGQEQRQEQQQQQPVTPQPPQLARKPREYNRADRLGQIVQPDREAGPNQEAIEKLLQATRRSDPDIIEKSASPSAPQTPTNNSTSKRYRVPLELTGKVSVTIKLPTRRVTKSVPRLQTSAEFAAQLVREHRLEFDFEEDDNEELILWECIDGTRRPLRDYEHIAAVVQRWGNRTGNRCYLRTSSPQLRNDVDSLASLVPRRDMLRTPPILLGAEIHFSRPSIMYNPHAHHSSNPNLLEGTTRRGSAESVNSTNSPPGSDKLKRVPSKLNPSDECLSVSARQLEAEQDEYALEKQLVWGFGSADLAGNRIILKQKPGDELVSSNDTSDIDIYEWPLAGPKKYNFVIRSQRNTNQAVYISTDSAKAFSVIRNAVFTARSKALMANRR